MSTLDKDFICEACETLELTIENLLLMAYSIENGREIDADGLTYLTPRLQYIKSVLKDEFDHLNREDGIKP